MADDDELTKRRKAHAKRFEEYRNLTGCQIAAMVWPHLLNRAWKALALLPSRTLAEKMRRMNIMMRFELVIEARWQRER